MLDKVIKQGTDLSSFHISLALNYLPPFNLLYRLLTVALLSLSFKGLERSIISQSDSCLGVKSRDLASTPSSYHPTKGLKRIS